MLSLGIAAGVEPAADTGVLPMAAVALSAGSSGGGEESASRPLRAGSRCMAERDGSIRPTMPAARGPAGAGSSLGIDVSERRGLDLVLLDVSRAPVFVRADVAVEALPNLIAELRPDVVAVDAPCGWSVEGGSRV